MKKFDKLQIFTQYILYKRAQGRFFGGKRKKRKGKKYFLRSRSRRGKQSVRRWRRHDCRAVAAKDGHAGKIRACDGDFVDFARLFDVSHRLFLARIVRLFRAHSYGDRSNRRRAVRGETFGQIARKNGEFTLCRIAGGCGAIFVF